MKVKYTASINGVEIITHVGERPYDPAATEAYIRPMIREGMTEEQITALIRANPQYADPANGVIISDEEGAEITARFKALREKEFLSADGQTVIHDYRGDKEYWHKDDSGHWNGFKITALGVNPAPGAKLLEQLTGEEQQEVRNQIEAARIAGLNDSQREKELQAKLDALADEALRAAQRSQVQGNPIDPAAWYQQHEEEIRAKYAAPVDNAA